MTLKMLGKKSKPIFAGKAAETHLLLQFVTSLLEEYFGELMGVNEDVALRSNFLLEACREASKFDQVLENIDGRYMDTSASKLLLHHYVRFIVFWDKCHGDLLPKHHLMLHLILRTTHIGNPMRYHTYRDESLNGVIARIARTCHATTFYHVLHTKFNLSLELGSAQDIN